MKFNLKIYVSCLIVFLFLFVLTFVPGTTSANGPKEKGERSTTEKSAKDARAKTVDIASAREKGDRPAPVSATPSTPRSKRGPLSRVAEFIKDLFVSSDKKAARPEADEDEADGNDPDLPGKKFLGRIDKKEYLRLRDEHINRLRGVEPGMPFDASIRGKAIVQMQQQETALLKAAQESKGPLAPLVFPFWTSIGPRPVPNGSSQPGTLGPVTGRVTAIAADPTNSSIVYLGTAQGGVWRTTNGGTTWVAIFDNAQSLGIGAIALAPSNHDILYIGTGESNLCADCFAGVGLYRIDNASTTIGALADLKGPINPAFSYVSSGAGNPTINTTVFGGRAISRIAVHPTIPGTIFVGTSTGSVGDNGATPVTNASLVGVYRSTNADVAAASVTFEKLPVITLAGASSDTPATGNRRISDLIFEPGNPNNLLVSTFGAAAVGDGGIFRTTNSLAVPGSTVAFTNTFTIGANRIQFGINKTGAVITVLAAINEPAAAPCPANQAGRVHRSVDGGVTWPATLGPAPGVGGILTGADGFCGGQCFYNVDVEIDPNDVNTVYLAGNARGTCSDAVKKSSDGGQTWARDDTAVHADSHVFAFDALSSPSVVYTGNDGGVWKRIANLPAASAWTNLNNSPLDTIQFESVAIHPTDANFTIGGTQDNGTEAQDTPPAGPSVSGTWINAEGGDGGYALIDQSSDATNITMYHTFFNQTNNLIGFDRANLRSCLGDHDGWESRGFGFGTDATPSCDGTAFAAANGITNDPAVLFYAPMALGPNPGTNDIHNGANTLYFGTDRLYRSINKGDTMTVVSQAPIVSAQPISTIGVSPQDDTYRLVGLTNGTIWGTSTGSSTLVNLTSGSFPASLPGGSKFTGRVYFDPLNKNVAYVTFAYYATAGQNVWKISNFTAAAAPAGPAPTWTAVGNGIPSIPVNAFVIDPGNSSRLFAGTDIGVYASFDGGANWSPFGQGLPKVSVFSMDIQPTARILRVATHGRGMWEINLIGPTAAEATISGRITTTEGAPLAGVTVRLSGANTLAAISDNTGSYRFDNLDTNNFYTVTPDFVNYHFTPANRSFSLVANHTDAVFTASADASATANAIDTNEFFVRQQYLDFLGREPDSGGFAYWTGKLNQCNGDVGCLRNGRIETSAAFFRSQEFQETGSYIYRLYQGALGRQLSFDEFAADRRQVVGGANLDAAKSAFASAFVNRAEFAQKYGANTSGESFVDALLQTLRDSASVDLSSERTNLISRYNSGATTIEGRALVLRAVGDNASFASAAYNPSFVLMEYFGYLLRGAEPAGYAFWLNVLNNGDAGNYRGMVCSFLTSTEYQRRFGAVVTHSNSECSAGR